MAQLVEWRIAENKWGAFLSRLSATSISSHSLPAYSGGRSQMAIQKPHPIQGDFQLKMLIQRILEKNSLGTRERT